MTGRVANPESAAVDEGDTGAVVGEIVVGGTVVGGIVLGGNVVAGGNVVVRAAVVGGDVVVDAAVVVVALSVEAFLLELSSPAAALTATRTMKASATHDTICAHNGQPRNRRQGFRDFGEVPVLAPAKFGCVSGAYHFPSEACHQPSPWE